jgi:hypothetical protein
VVEHVESIELASSDVVSKACFCSRQRYEKSWIDILPRSRTYQICALTNHR